MPAYYNENNPRKAAWLLELIKAGLIAPGDVDQRSIEDVSPDDLRGYTQCHFFAGIGVWSRALRLAGWSDDRPVWTLSCPCQPFSTAGKGGGFADERHLWPAAHHLIKALRPVTAFGEQVASKDGLTWLDLVEADLEGEDYTFGAVDSCAAGFGAPHIRQRLYWVADSGSEGLQVRQCQDLRGAWRREERRTAQQRGGASGWVEDTTCQRLQRRPLTGGVKHTEPNGLLSAGSSDDVGGLDNTQRDGRGAGRDHDAGHDGILSHPDGDTRWPGPTNGQWGASDWLLCRDGKWRPVEPGTFPLAHGAPARVGRLRGYGDAIVLPQAQAFIEAYLTLDIPESVVYLGPDWNYFASQKA